MARMPTFKRPREFDRLSLVLAPFKHGPERLAAAQRIKLWTRGRFGLADDATLLVTELESALPGFPPLQTVVAFWAARHTPSERP